MSWNKPIEDLLDKIRSNCIVLSSKHIQNHLYYKRVSKYFEIPTIVLSVFSGSFSVGSDGFLGQSTISVTTCTISMIITILTSIKLYMKINENLADEQELAISFKILALEIFKILSIPEDNRGVDGVKYLNDTYAKYLKMIENSAILNRDTKIDQLLIYDKEKVKKPSLTPFVEVENYKRSIAHQNNIEKTNIYPEHFKHNPIFDESNSENSEINNDKNISISDGSNSENSDKNNSNSDENMNIFIDKATI